MSSRDATWPRSARRLSAAFVLVTLLVGSSVSFGATTPAHSHLSRATTVTFVGHGWGPGIGMGQWGAFGYAVRYHFGYERILNHYYGETTASSVAATGQGTNPTMSVVISENMNLSTNVGYDPLVTAATPFTVTSNGGTPTVPTTTSTTISPTTTIASTSTSVAPATSFAVPAGTAIDLHLEANGTWNAYESSSCPSALASVTSGTPVATGLVNPVIVPSVAVTAPISQLLVLCRHDGIDESVRGSIEAYDRSGYERTLNLVPLETYLQGVVPSESSASWGNDGGSVGSPQGEPWGFQALEAQAVAARSYAMAYSAAGGWNGYASICDTTTCQVYTGADYETAISNAAVQATAGQIRVRPNAPTAAVSTQFSASTGGYTAPSTFGAVHDLGDACVDPGVPLECNPNHTWRVTIDAATIMKHYPKIGRLLTVHVATRNGDGVEGGRALTVILRGKKSTIRVTGDALSSTLGLKSDWFAIARITRAAPKVSTTTTTMTTTTTTTVPVTSTVPVTTSVPTTTVP